MKKRGIIICLLLIFFVGFVSASFQIGNLSHALTQTAYGPRTPINGWINISLNNESTNSLFRSSNNNSITLIDLLKKPTNSGVVYSCNTLNCVSDHSATSSQETKNFTLNSNNSKILGVKFTTNVTVNNVSFVVQSNAQESCTNQLQIDLLNDGTIEKGNNKSFNGSCPNQRSTSCFNAQDQTENYQITSVNQYKHCQKFNLTKSPGFKLGAWVKGNNDSRRLQMGLYNIYGESLKECNLSFVRTSEGNVSCDVDYLVTEQEQAYVCIYGNSSPVNQYIAEIKGYDTTPNGCGFYSEYIVGGSENFAFNIFIEGKKFDAMGTVRITNSLPNDNFLSELINTYVGSTYPGGCSGPNPCYVPIKFISSTNQQSIVINQINIVLTTGGGSITQHNFSDFTETPARINSNFQKIFLNEGGFNTGQNYGNETFSLKLGNNQIFSQNISIEMLPIISYLTPTTTAYGFPTEFIAIINSSLNITRYDWNFGANQTLSTNVNKVTHTYNSSGQYFLTVTVTDTSQRSSSKTFNISVTGPQEKINESLSEMLRNLANVKAQIARFDAYSQERLNSYLNLGDIERTLTELQRNYTRANTTQEYYRIIETLFSLNVPESIIKTKNADSILYYPNKNLIDLNVIEEITNESLPASNQNAYSDAILSWNQENLETKITFREFSKKIGAVTEPLLNIFELEITEKNSLTSNPFLIFRDMQDLSFKENYGQRNISGYKYIELTGSKNIIFSTTENVDFTNLPVFISPALSELTISGDNGNAPSKASKWLLFILVLGILIVVGVIAYTAMQIWYKKKYENSLFPNKNNLYNLVNYISGAKKQGIPEKDIINNLKKAKWSSEQITYIMKKLAGKRTGMYELPIGNVIESFNKKEAPKPAQGTDFQKFPFQRDKFNRSPY